MNSSRTHNQQGVRFKCFHVLHLILISFLEESNMDFNLVGLKLGTDTQPMHGPEFSRHGKVPVPAHPIRHIGIKNMLRNEDFLPVQNCCCLRVAPSRNNSSSVDGGGGTILYKFNRISFPDSDHLLSNTSLLLSNFCKGLLLLYEKRCENIKSSVTPTIGSDAAFQEGVRQPPGNPSPPPRGGSHSPPLPDRFPPSSGRRRAPPCCSHQSPTRR